MIERRLCARFAVPGSTVSCRRRGFLGRFLSLLADYCPLIDLSKGGISFLTDRLFKQGQKLSLLLSCPEWKQPVPFEGKVVHVGISPGKSFKYRVGIQFNPFGVRSGQNAPESLQKLAELEKSYGSQQ